ncbi:MAG: carboxypeptidase-like regulatory domain-containing protein, partial [Terriglobia bacterium]
MICSFCFVGALLCRVSAQTPRISFHGRVLDRTLAPIPGARITASPESRSPTASTVCDASGGFSLSLEPGSYTI